MANYYGLDHAMVNYIHVHISNAHIHPPPLHTHTYLHYPHIHTSAHADGTSDYSSDLRVTRSR